MIPKRGNPWIYLNYATLKEHKLRNDVVESALAKWLGEHEGVEAVFTKSQMLKEEAKEPSEVEMMVRRSFYADCSGDVMVITKPYYVFGPPKLSKNPDKWPTYRAMHGTPHAYDTHVPLLVMGPRIEPGVRDDRIVPQVMAAILAEALAVPRPKDAGYAVPAKLFKK